MIPEGEPTASNFKNGSVYELIMPWHENEPSLLWFAATSREGERKPSLNLVNLDDRLRDEGREEESESRTRLSKDSKGPAAISGECIDS